jgi:hypothetical protein
MNSVNKIFYSNDIDEKLIFLKLWKKCPTKCPGCSFGTEKENQYFDIDTIISNIKNFNRLHNNGFSYFLYGINCLDYKNLDKLLSFINFYNTNIIIQIDVDDLMKNEKLLWMLVKEYWNISFLVSTNLFTTEGLNKKLNIINYFSKKSYRINFDIITQVWRFNEEVKDFLLSCNRVWKDKIHKNIFFNKLSIEGTISNSVKIDNEGKIIRGIPYTNCVMWDFFEIDWPTKINLSSHIEINLNGSLTFHTPICYLWSIEISHIDKNSSEIIEDFIKFKQNFVEQKSSNMKWECYKCIYSKWYKY